MAKLLFIILLFFGDFGFGQGSYPTKSELFKSLTKETKLKRKVYNSTNWFTVQNDSSYQSADTLYFYNNPAFRYEKHFCEFVDWNFYKKDAFWIQRLQLCKEPTTASATKEKDFFTFEIPDKQRPLVLQIFQKGKIVDRFEVVSLRKQPLNSRKDETTDVLTLRRIRKGDTEPAANSSF
jgi:hypothetical protein